MVETPTNHPVSPDQRLRSGALQGEIGKHCTNRSTRLIMFAVCGIRHIPRVFIHVYQSPGKYDSNF